ncbi:MAG: AAA family ATPase [Planctomycetota bacterium]
MSMTTARPPQSSGIRIDAVRIRHFRSLRNVEVTLADTCLLVGMNNSGKTSFLRALHLALGTDRRLISSDDFFVDDSGQATEILIDVRIVPIGEDGKRANQFPNPWIESDFGGAGLISTDTSDCEFIAFRTRITYDVVKSDFNLERSRLQDWPDLADWEEAPVGSKVARFAQLLSFFIDAQRDVIADLRTPTSFFGRLLSKIEIPDELIMEVEQQLSGLNEEIVDNSEVLAHIRDALSVLNQTVPAFGEGVELTPVSKKLRDLTKGLGVQFSDSNGSSFPLQSHGMGTRSWASLLSFEAYVSWTAKLSADRGLPFHPVLSLEEPEAHLHPNAQRAVHDQLSRGLGQRIISTHSPYIAGQAELGELLHFSKKGTETRVNRLPMDELEPEEIRKIRREVMRSRGELLFARAVVLFEGETEEQALPMFARHHWGRHSFERGASFVGVGGDGNYFPFIRIFEAFQVPWFIFSDGEVDARKAVEAALTKANLQAPHHNVVTIPKNQGIEGYLVTEGYKLELKQAVIKQAGPYHSENHRQAKEQEIAGWTDEELEAHMKGNKTAMAPHWARAIIDSGGERSVPVAIKKLLVAVGELLSENRATADG